MVRDRWYLFQFLSKRIRLVLSLILDSVGFFSIKQSLLCRVGIFRLWIAYARPLIFFYYNILRRLDIHITCPVAKKLSCSHMRALREWAAHPRWEYWALLCSLSLCHVFFDLLNSYRGSLLLCGLRDCLFCCKRKHHLIQFIWVSRLGPSMIPSPHCLHLGMLWRWGLNILRLNLACQVQLCGRQEKWATTSQA